MYVIYSWDRYCCFLTLRRRIYVIIAVYKMNAQKECEAVIHVSTPQKIPERRNNNNFTYISILIKKNIFSSDADDGYTKKNGKLQMKRSFFFSFFTTSSYSYI